MQAPPLLTTPGRHVRVPTARVVEGEKRSGVRMCLLRRRWSLLQANGTRAEAPTSDGPGLALRPQSFCREAERYRAPRVRWCRYL